jgi:hypothetical protein
MAIYNEILVGRFSRSIQKLFGMKGGAAVRQVAGEVSISHALRSGRENRFLEEWFLFGARAQIAGIAAQDSVARFTNPAGSNIVAVIESLKVAGTANTEMTVEYSNSPQANLTNVSSNANFDKRSKPADVGNNGATCTLSITNNIGQIGVIFDDIVVGSTTSPELINYEEQEITLFPGTALQVRTLTLNVSLGVTLRWRERLLEDSERS